MAQRKPFLLRVSAEVLEEMRRWAADEMRSLNGQIEYVLRDALRRRGVHDDPKSSKGNLRPHQSSRPREPRHSG